jgi:carboxypeptidase family protein
MRSVLFFLLLPTFALAQSSTPHPENLSTVTGHITCSDTQRPARLAEVRLISVLAPTTDNFGYQTPTVGSGVNGLAAHTDLTGGYTIADVEPGQYYLRVELPGYATPISQFTLDDLKSPAPEVQQRIQSELQLVTVAPHSTVEADATLHRGASISGTVTFDDGAPAVAFRIALLRHDASGKLQEVHNGAYAVTNPRGQFSIESLSPGDYVIEAKLITFDQSQLITAANGTMKTTPAETASSVWPVYSGNVFRQKDAATIKVDSGQETTAADISIPLSRLHEISGTVLAKGGHAINSAWIELLDPDTREKVATAYPHDEGTFHLRNIPEGTYILTVTNAEDLGPVEVHSTPNHANDAIGPRTLRTYGNLEQPLTVQTDIQSLILTLPNKPTPPNNSTGNN